MSRRGTADFEVIYVCNRETNDDFGLKQVPQAMKSRLQAISPSLLLTLLLTVLLSCENRTEYEPSYTWSPVEITPDIEPSATVESIIAPYRARLDSIMNEVIGYAAYDLTPRGQYESTLGTFVTKLIWARSAIAFDQQVDVSIMNHHGGLRAPINEGPITLGEVFEIMPFENEVLLLEIPGEQLTQVIEHIGKSGSSMIWPVSFEVHQNRAKSIRVDGQEIDEEKIYTLAISDYLANGGSGFQMLRPLKRLEVEPIKLRDMIVQEIREQTAQGDSISSQVANFITVAD